MTVIDPIRYLRVVTGGASSVSVDDTASVVDMADFLAMSGAMGSNGRNCNVPIIDLAVNWDPARAPAFFEYLRTDDTDDLDDLCTKDGCHPAETALSASHTANVVKRGVTAWQNSGTYAYRPPIGSVRTPAGHDLPHHGVAGCRAPSSGRCRQAFSPFSSH